MDLTKLKDIFAFHFMCHSKTHFNFVFYTNTTGFRCNEKEIHPRYVKILGEHHNDFTKQKWRHTIFDHPKIFVTEERFFDYDTLEE